MIAKKSLIVAALGISASLIAISAQAGGTSYALCHNIGGPRDLGANCEATGNCSVALASGEVLTFAANEFLGIIINASDGAWMAHLAHGDGFATRVFDPPLHLAGLRSPEHDGEAAARSQSPTAS